MRNGASEFQIWVINTNLQEIRIVGPRYISANNQEGDTRIFRKLDCSFVNGNWCEKRSESYRSTLAPGIFDHCPLLICIEESSRSIKTPIRFFDI